MWLVLQNLPRAVVVPPLALALQVYPLMVNMISEHIETRTSNVECDVFYRLPAPALPQDYHSYIHPFPILFTDTAPGPSDHDTR